jgi:hypothetical protein
MNVLAANQIRRGLNQNREPERFLVNRDIARLGGYTENNFSKPYRTIV